ncbi:hypothetical protein WJX73_003439 [Symbiochloris irregularis]|uniref:PX domain-containing protein n=1 Tax=Symbiochloris irregularis TaxID=706552 RepID=A0AAW1PP26_9CHLO
MSQAYPLQEPDAHLQEPSDAGDSRSAPQENPPPAYDSLVLSNEKASAPALSRFDITVKDPVKQGDSVGAYVSYKVCTQTGSSQYQSQQSEVIRRFRDFAWLRDRLAEQNRGVILPPLPEKNVVQKYQMTNEFIEQRRRALAVFINRVAAHPGLQASTALQSFLEASEEDFALDVSRQAQQEGGGAKKKLASTLQLFRDLGASTASLVTGRSLEEEEDPEYLKVQEYMVALESHLGEVQRQAQRLLKHQTGYGAALAEFGAAMATMGQAEQPRLASAFSVMGDKAAAAASSSQKQAEELGCSLDAPLREGAKAVKEVQAVMSDRAAALAAVQQARGDVDTRRAKLTKLRVIAGIKEEKVAEAERDLLEATMRVESAKKAGLALLEVTWSLTIMSINIIDPLDW